MHSVLGLILCRYLDASALQVALLTTLRPVVSLFSFYWGSFIQESSASLKKNLLLAHAFSLLPFLFVPLCPTTPYLLFASAIFTLFYRAEAPALMEILRRNLTKKEREKDFSQATTCAYVEGICIAFVSGWLIQEYGTSWSYLFSFYAFVSLIALWFQYRLPVLEIETTLDAPRKFSFLEPITTAIDILQRKPAFLRFQMGYMLCGGGLMLAMPALTGFLSHQPLGFAILFTSMGAIKQLGMIVAAPLWGRFMQRIRYETLSAIVFLCVAAFLFALCGPSLGIVTLFSAYFLYGVAQAGSHMIWNLSGPYFSQNEESSRYTMVNVFMVGIRGLFLPALGGWIADAFGAPVAIGLGGFWCCLGAAALFFPVEAQSPAAVLEKK